MLAEIHLLAAIQPAVRACQFSQAGAPENGHPKMLSSLSALPLSSARLLKPKTVNPRISSVTSAPQEWRRKVFPNAAAALDTELSDEVGEVDNGEAEFELDSSVFETVFPSVAKVEKKPVGGARVKGLPVPQSTLIPDDWKDVQQYYHRSKKDRKQETLARQIEWAKQRAAEARATRLQIENEQRFLRGQALVAAGDAAQSGDEAAAVEDDDDDEWQEERVEESETGVGMPVAASGRARPKDFRSELQFNSFEDIAESLREEELESREAEFRQVQAERSRRADAEETRAPVVEKESLLTAEERALLRSRDVHFARISSKKWSPLHTLAASGQVYLAAEMLKKGVDLDIVDNDGLTPLHRAVQAGRKTMIRMLLKAGANPLVLDREGATLVHYSAQIGNHEISKLLIRHGVDVNVADVDGWTPLHVAVQSGRLELVKALVYRGADITIANKEGNTPLDVALAFGSCFNFYDAIKFLKKRLVFDSESRFDNSEDNQFIER